MGTVAKSSITLTSISDAYSVSLSPSVCVIHADFDGTNPILTNAYTLISVYCGEVKVPFNIEMVTASHISIASKISKIDDYTYKLAITSLHYTLLEGGLDITVNVNNYTTLTGRFLFSVERESTMLDWIQAWENNKTTIGSDSIITPRIFVGKKITGSYESLDAVPGLTGVYIGPSSNDSCGVYGYKDSIEIFHLDETGGKIGGWNILEGGLYSSNGRLKILSTGAIYAVNDENDVIWEVRENGYASFAMENVRFYPNGDAEFTGKIVANEGKIAGWTINEENLYNVQVGLSSVYKYVAIANITAIPILLGGTWDGNHLSWVKAYGGVAMYYTSKTNYGFIGYKGNSLVFSSGSTNYIAGWNFDESAIWLGTKNNNSAQYTDASGSLTIGTNGLRGYSWYIDKDGTASFVKGLVKFGLTSGTIVGWTLTTNKIATNNIALISASGTSGLYLTASDDGHFIDRGPDAMENFINTCGGLYLNIKSGSAEFVARDSGGNLLFNLSSHHTSSISGWTLGTQRLSTKHIALVSLEGVTGLYMSSSSDVNLTTLSTSDLSSTINSKGGIYLRTTGVSAEFVARDSGGNLLFNLSNTGISHIAGWAFSTTSLYTGAQTTSGYANSGCISIGPTGLRGYKWRFENDGSGGIAGDNITWDKDGNIKFAPSVSMFWETGINVAQMIAFGQMLYRDPEFTKDKKNGTGLYQNGHIDYATFSANALLNTLQNYGLFLKGSGIVTRVDIVSNTGSVATVWTGSQALSQNSIEILSARQIDSTSTIRITFQGEDASILVGAAFSGDSITSWLTIPSINTGEVVVQTSRELVSDTSAPNSTQKAVKYICTRWNNVGDYRLGGFYFGNPSRANAKFVVKIIAKIPVGWVIENYHNAYGTGASMQWATSQEGTGKYEEYICIVKCGSTGTFSTTNFFALKCNSAYTPVAATDAYGLDIKRTNIETGNVETLSNVVWYVAYATVFDATSSDKVTTTIDKNGIYTGTLRADQIIAGTIDATKISADVILSNGNAWALNKDGSGFLANKNISWDKDGNTSFNGKIIATSGSIAGFNISSGHIGVESSASDSSSSAEWASLSIYKDFFKVGGSKGYVMLGNDVIPGTAGGAFTAVGRIVNQASNTYGSYGFDQANYGLFINVSGGTKNYGISSNAALMAPSFINTKAQLLTFTGGNYTVDFSQNNVILMYYNQSGYSGCDVTLPTESSVAYKFGLSSLPNDFATVVIFQVRQGSLPITLKGIYNHNEDLADYKMSEGDFVTVLISKCDGFRYQILNHSS